MLSATCQTQEVSRPDAIQFIPQPAPPEVQTETRLPGLDGLRGLAILLVMLLHFGGSEKLPGLKKMDLSWIEQAYLKVVDAGACGVDLFFVLSGFLITGILLNTKESPRFFRTFYLRRTLRIFPLYFGVLFLFLCVIPLFPLTNRSALHQIAEHQTWLWVYCANIPIAYEEATVFNVDWIQFSHFWSLAVEEHFYLIWPAVVFACSRQNLIRVCTGCIVAAFALRLAFCGFGHSWSAYVLTPCRMDGLALGALLAVLGREPLGLSRLFRWACIVTPLAFAVVLALSFVKAKIPAAGWAIGATSSSLYAIFFGGLIVFSVQCKPDGLVHKLFCFRLLTFLGKYSYGLYVYHYLLRPVFQALIPIESLVAWLGSSFLGLLLYAVLAIMLSIIPAWLSWHLIEKRILGLKKYFNYEVEADPQEKARQQLISLTFAKSA